MPSFRSKVVIGLVRNRHLMKGKLKPEVVDETFSVEEFRRSVDQQSARAKMPKGVTVTPVTVAEMYAEWITPEGAPQDKVILYIHGGGFMSGSCLTHRMHVAKFALGTGVKALLFDYRLAPEHPYPAAVDDCLAAYRWLLAEGYAPANIVIAGESAGGTLTLATARGAARPRPAAPQRRRLHLARHRPDVQRAVVPPQLQDRYRALQLVEDLDAVLHRR